MAFSSSSYAGTYTGGRGRRRGFILGPVIIALIVIAIQYFGAETYTNPETGEVTRVALSPTEEASLGLQSYREILSQSKTIDSGPQFEMVNRVAERLINVVDPASQELSWAVRVIESPEPNAFCLPGGKIAVYTGILPIAGDDDGLAAVMGHELAHATARHGAQRLLQQRLVQTGMIGLSGSTQDMDPRQRQLILGALGAGAQFGLILPYSRDHESEADEMGLRYLIRAGYDPEAPVRFWERMQQSSQGSPPEFASTHPAHETRIAWLRELVSEYQRSGTVAGRPLSSNP